MQDKVQAKLKYLKEKKIHLKFIIMIIIYLLDFSI